jgi:hypothetical protein
MLGFVPGIHVFATSEVMDGRVKPDHDGRRPGAGVVQW